MSPKFTAIPARGKKCDALKKPKKKPDHEGRANRVWGRVKFKQRLAYLARNFVFFLPDADGSAGGVRGRVFQRGRRLTC